MEPLYAGPPESPEQMVVYPGVGLGPAAQNAVGASKLATLGQGATPLETTMPPYLWVRGTGSRLSGCDGNDLPKKEAVNSLVLTGD